MVLAGLWSGGLVLGMPIAMLSSLLGLGVGMFGVIGADSRHFPTDAGYWRQVLRVGSALRLAET